MYIAWDFLRGDIFVGNNSFLDQNDKLRSFFLKSLAPGACIGNTCARGACTRGIYFGGTCIGVANTRSACTRSSYAISAYTEGACTKGACFGDTSTRDTYTGGIFTQSVCIKDVYIRCTCIADPCAGGFWVTNACTYASDFCIRAWVACGTSTCIGSAYVNNVSTIKQSGIYLQFFQNLEMGGTRLEIQVRAS